MISRGELIQTIIMLEADLPTLPARVGTLDKASLTKAYEGAAALLGDLDALRALVVQGKDLLHGEVVNRNGGLS